MWSLVIVTPPIASPHLNLKFTGCITSLLPQIYRHLYVYENNLSSLSVRLSPPFASYCGVISAARLTFAAFRIFSRYRTFVKCIISLCHLPNSSELSTAWSPSRSLLDLTIIFVCFITSGLLENRDIFLVSWSTFLWHHKHHKIEYKRRIRIGFGYECTDPQ